MLYDLLEKYQDEILSITEEKTLLLAGPLESSIEMRQGLPDFYEQLLKYLKRTVINSAEEKILVDATEHGKELLRLGYSLSQVVHAYGAICQAITELAYKKNISISAKEFKSLNFCLDIAIAAAVTEYQFRSVNISEQNEIQNIGTLAHELRNALSSATIAHDMIKQGLVGTGGSTAKILEENLAQMQYLIDRTLSEVRLRVEPEIESEIFYLENLVDQILLTSRVAGTKKKLKLINTITQKTELKTDRQLLLSALANLIQNAIKYSRDDGHIVIQAKAAGENIVIEVLDECGGMEKNKIDALFKPFTFGSKDRSGMGLGLTIVKRAVTLLQGKISTYNNPGNGCAFVIEIPKILNADQANKKKVPDKKLIQPKLNK